MNGDSHKFLTLRTCVTSDFCPYRFVYHIKRPFRRQFCSLKLAGASSCLLGVNFAFLASAGSSHCCLGVSFVDRAIPLAQAPQSSFSSTSTRQHTNCRHHLPQSAEQIHLRTACRNLNLKEICEQISATHSIALFCAHICTYTSTARNVNFERCC